MESLGAFSGRSLLSRFFCKFCQITWISFLKNYCNFVIKFFCFWKKTFFWKKTSRLYEDKVLFFSLRKNFFISSSKIMKTLFILLLYLILKFQHSNQSEIKINGIHNPPFVICENGIVKGGIEYDLFKFYYFDYFAKFATAFQIFVEKSHPCRQLHLC